MVWLLPSFFLSVFFYNLKKIFFHNYFLFFILITLFYFILSSSFFLSFFPFLLFILSCVDNRLLVHQPGIRAVPLKWDSQVQDTGSQETSAPCTVKRQKFPRDLHLYAKTQFHSTTSKLQCWTPHAKQLARQEHNPIH